MESCCSEPVQVGSAVPDFEMETYDPKTGDFGKLSLAAQKGAKRWTILFFYPADFTFVCATEFAALAEQQDRFAKMGADIVTVSCDTKFAHLGWHTVEKELAKATYQMGADTTGAVARLFGVYLEKAGLALRGTFMINPEGVLVGSEINFLNCGRNVDELMRKFKANVYLHKKPKEVCPAKWKDEGDVTLKPSARMVGMVHEALANKGVAK